MSCIASNISWGMLYVFQALPLCISIQNEWRFVIGIYRDDVLGDKGVSCGGIVVMWPLTMAQWPWTWNSFPLCSVSPEWLKIFWLSWWAGVTFDHGTVTLNLKFLSALLCISWTIEDFLAHRWAGVITWRPLSSSVSRERFVMLELLIQNIYM
jgi:hypothetical protein